WPAPLQGRSGGAYFVNRSTRAPQFMSDLSLPIPAIDTPIAFVDLETTGGSVAEHRITEIGIVQVGPSGVSRWSTLVNPQQHIPPFIQSLTGITDDMV